MADDARRRLAAFAGRRRTEAPDLASIDILDWEPEAVEAARFVWRRRVVNERLSVDLAVQLRRAAARLPELGAEFDDALARLEEDERAHVSLAGAVLARIQGAPAPAEEPVDLSNEPPEIALARLVLTGLCVCETVSAARFATVRDHTDLPAFRACIDVFHRDELAHAELGFLLGPAALARLRAAVGPDRAGEIATEELRGTFGHLDRVVGLDLERRGPLPAPRPQPADNPGVVEPAMDAIAFYQAIHEEIVPRLEGLGIDARGAWTRRHA